MSFTNFTCTMLEYFAFVFPQDNELLKIYVAIDKKPKKSHLFLSYEHFNFSEILKNKQIYYLVNSTWYKTWYVALFSEYLREWTTKTWCCLNSWEWYFPWNGKSFIRFYCIRRLINFLKNNEPNRRKSIITSASVYFLAYSVKAFSLSFRLHLRGLEKLNFIFKTKLKKNGFTENIGFWFFQHELLRK